MLNGLLDLFLPPVCLACDKSIAPGDNARLVCRRCRTLLRPPPPPLCQRCGAPRLRTGRPDTEDCSECAAWPSSLRYARSAYVLHPPADRIVHQLKYRGWSALGELMGEALSRIDVPDALRASDVVQAVPTTRNRIRDRGYNQAALIATAYAQKSGKTLVDWLERAPGKSSQTALHPAERAANVAGAFRLRPAYRHCVTGSRIIVIDDVLTTGATISECTDTLAAAGAASVCALSYARALDTLRLLAH
jgi:ComF family protein